jgi:hypothetical protein
VVLSPVGGGTVPPKRWNTPKILHGAATQNFMASSLKNSVQTPVVIHISSDKFAQDSQISISTCTVGKFWLVAWLVGLTRFGAL